MLKGGHLLFASFQLEEWGLRSNTHTNKVPADFAAAGVAKRLRQSPAEATLAVLSRKAMTGRQR